EVIPEDADARLSLAQFYLLSGQRPHALRLMTDGAQYGLPPPAALQAEMEVMFAGEDWDSALRLCDRLLPRLGTPGLWAPPQGVRARKLAVLVALGRAPEALQLAEAEGEATDSSVKLQRARALAATGRTGEAVTLLRQWHAAAKPDVAPAFLREEATTLREAG